MSRNRSRLRAKTNSRNLLRRASTTSLLGSEIPSKLGGVDTTFRSVYDIENHAPEGDLREWTNREHLGGQPTSAAVSSIAADGFKSASRRPLKLKRKDSFTEIYGDDADRDEEGKWATNAFKKLKERAEKQMIDAYIGKERPLTTISGQQENGFIFHPDTVLPTYNLERTRRNIMHSMEGDGFYVPKQPVIARETLERVEKRLIWTEPNNGRNWFDAFHQLIAQPIPTTCRARRPFRPVPTLLWHSTRTYPDDSQLAETSDSNSQHLDGLAVTRDHIVAHSSFVPAGNVSGSSSIKSGRSTYLLVFDIDALSLMDHPWMSQEMRLALQLEDRVAMLRERQRQQVVQGLTTQFEVARDAYVDFKARHPLPTLASLDVNTLQSAGEITRALNERQERIRELHVLRQLRNTEAQTDRLLEFKILQDWDRIRHLRDTQGHAATSLTLLIEAAESDLEEDYRWFNTEVQNELADIHDERELRAAQRSREASTIEVLHTQQKTAHVPSRRVSTSNRLRARNRINDDDHEALERAVRQRLESSFRPPGFPIFSFRCSTVHAAGGPLTEYNALKSQWHREPYKVPQLYLRVLIDAKEVTRTTARPLQMPYFRTHFRDLDFTFSVFDILTKSSLPLRAGHPQQKITEQTHHEGRTADAQHRCAFGVRVGEVPRSIQIEIYEKGMFSDTLVAALPVPIPLPSDTAQSVDRVYLPLQFSGRFNSTGPDTWTSGVLRLACSWAADNAGKILAPPSVSNACSPHDHPVMSIATLMSPLGVVNFWKLMGWVQDQATDPNDPRSQELPRFNRLQGDRENSGDNPRASILRESFRLEIPAWIRMSILNIGVDDQSTRATLLFKRNENRCRGSKLAVLAIPLQDFEIEQSLIQDITRGDQHVDERPPLPRITSQNSSTVSLQPIPSALSPQALFRPGADHVPLVRRIRAHDLLRHAYRPRAKRHDDLVREEKLVARPQYPFFTLPLFLRPRRPLRPTRRDRCDIAAADPALPESCKILIHVLRAANVPERVSERAPGVSIGADERRQATMVRPFVQVLFQGATARTAAGEGTNPQWNETLSIDVGLSDGDSGVVALPSDVATDSVRIDLFDEVIVDLAKDDHRQRLVHQRNDRAWLGYISIPFATFQDQTRLAGEFHVRQPYALVGYDGNEDKSSVGAPTHKNVSLHMFITLEPMLPAAIGPDFEFQPLDPPFVQRQSIAFHTNLPRVAQGRGIRTLCDTLSGNTALITRFVRAQTGPGMVVAARGGLSSAWAAVRYVSLIPTFPSRALYGRDLWITTDQMLTLGAAAAVEHAILLTNLFQQIFVTKECYVVLGSDAPGRKIAWVLTRDMTTEASRPPNGNGAEAKWMLWDPLEGRSWGAHDLRCPLTEIAQTFNQTNIWVNLQVPAHPAGMNFQFSDIRKWKAFFRPANAGSETQSIQSENPIYKAVDLASVAERQARIERCLVGAVESWRGVRLTRWNRLASRTFASLLPQLESSLLNNGPQQSMQNVINSQRELAKLRTVYHLGGSPLSMPYTDLNAVLHAVEATNIHGCEDEGCEFACAVWIAAYEGDVMAVWVWIATLVRKM
ncbi:hypothetical protein DFJ77DRAFT_549745 [Powellomyces hirtus]|nr:hypothetical protein DFJ77DRAFT_549745 [Powellomyces hirtus]